MSVRWGLNEKVKEADRRRRRYECMGHSRKLERKASERQFRREDRDMSSQMRQFVPDNEGNIKWGLYCRNIP